MPSSLGDDAYKRSLAANQRAAHVVATAGFFVSVGLGWGGVWFATMTVTSSCVCGVGVGCGRVCNTDLVMSWTHRASYFSLLPVHNDWINKDCGMCHPV